MKTNSSSNTQSKTQREISIEKGKDIVIGLIAFLILLEGAGLFIKTRTGQLILTADVIRFIF